MPEFALQPATTTDAHTLSLIGSATFLESFADVLPGENIARHCSRTHSARAYAAALRSGSRAWLACLGGTHTPVGYAMNTSPDLPIPVEERDVELKRIYLLSRFQGQGIGKALMDAAVKDARESSAPRLLLGVYRENVTALGFYKSIGFQVIGTRQFQVGEGVYDDLILALSLG